MDAAPAPGSSLPGAPGIARPTGSLDSAGSLGSTGSTGSTGSLDSAGSLGTLDRQRQGVGRGDLAALALAGTRAAPVTLASEHVLPVVPALRALFPTGLRRGSALAVTGGASWSMALAMAAASSAGGSWTVVLGAFDVGLGAAAGFGVAMERLVLVDPGSAWPVVLGVAADGFDVVIAHPPRSLALGTWRRVLARLRERGGVLIAVDPPSTLEVAATVVVEGRWTGVDAGAGRLQARLVTASVGGRGAMAKVRRCQLVLPGPTGAIDIAGQGGQAGAAVDDRSGRAGLRQVG